jgi:hypothetical protein
MYFPANCPLRALQTARLSGNIKRVPFGGADRQGSKFNIGSRTNTQEIPEYETHTDKGVAQCRKLFYRELLFASASRRGNVGSSSRYSEV